MERKPSPSDIAREQCESIRPMVEGLKKKTRLRPADLYDVFFAILYVLKNACTWRALPHDFPSWDRVYKYFLLCRTKLSKDKSSLLEQALKKSGGERTYQRWAQRNDEILHRRCTEREEHGYGTGKGR